MGSCTAAVHKGIVIKYLWNSFMFYQLSPVWRAERGQNPSVASDTGLGVGGGALGGCQGQGKTPKEILEGQPRDEAMWTVQPRREESDGGKMKGEK